MQAGTQVLARVRFGAFELELRTGELRRTGTVLHLSPQPFRVLLLLVSQPGQLITREEFRRAIWGNETFVDFEHGLNFAIKKIRDTLGDDAEHPRYIETLPRRGYRFIAPVEWLMPAAAAGESESAAAMFGNQREPAGQVASSETPVSHRGKRSFLIGRAAISLVVLCGIVFWLLRSPLPAPRITEYVQITHDYQLKEVAGADTNRIYVNLFIPHAIANVPLGGGKLVPIPIALPGEDRPIAGLAPGDFPNLLDLSPDGSRFLTSGPGYGLRSVQAAGNPVLHLGTAQDAAWSADGKSIVYTWLGDIFLMQSDGSNARLLVSAKNFPDGAQSNSDLSWSPDGTRIRFTHNHEIWELSSSGSNGHPILQGWRPSSWKCCGRWTPDGAFFVFVSGEPNILPFLAGNQLWAVDERQGFFRYPIAEPILLTPGPTRWASPIPSRDGKRIFARGLTLRGELVRYDAQAKQWRPFLGGQSIEFVSFSRDRKSVAYVTFPEEELWRANVDGTAAMKLTDAPFAVKSTDWSPDGTQILISANISNDNPHMYVLPSQGGVRMRLLPNGRHAESDPRWSPDGSRVVYSISGDAWKALDPVEIRILDIPTGKVTSIAGSGEDMSPRWSPDGRYIAALTISQHTLRTYDLVSRRWTTLFEGFANFPCWSKDGKFIYFGDERARISRVSGMLGPPEFVASFERIPSAETYGGWFGSDPDDVPLALRDKGIDEVYALTLMEK